jgi:hypothetical protein
MMGKGPWARVGDLLRCGVANRRPVIQKRILQLLPGTLRGGVEHLEVFECVLVRLNKHVEIENVTSSQFVTWLLRRPWGRRAFTGGHEGELSSGAPNCG